MFDGAVGGYVLIWGQMCLLCVDIRVAVLLCWE
jgi:hypothetical protein